MDIIKYLGLKLEELWEKLPDAGDDLEDDDLVVVAQYGFVEDIIDQIEDGKLWIDTTEQESQALLIANKYVSNISDEEKVKHLATEVVELARALERNDNKNIKEEIGDCAFILLHLLHRNGGGSLLSEILLAGKKMEECKNISGKNI